MLSFTANQAKTQFGEMIAKAQREPVSITKNGKPSVVVMSVDDYNELEALKLQLLRDRLAHSIAQAQAGQLHEGEAVFDELMKDL
ncbi:type II toxin-antitoxin system Phd/YefM family antitoxin [Enterobacteriaceae bacterium H20N1]|uniref:Antitoxin n=1 Tax=Dryocola boscaweniae TaxID=2925397 RepID=A0A9X3AQN0_9ENTR|nr:type II toxin-antitoxin system Phd/YefM family antitoxin [Dryocola boscaweniae]MCT4703295.1 type II toxin-antitoxin system Phd/YefM family antitoxin [Dryocola boscaweniae]MCT4715687.1 type II toxin-antitoxin system Phd/YefM family antitoxin [Dryocola boscaweniae]MCT4720463.1 type II toxin-antitoxin system Phd/YefM family antitoxin [Dryocola boscaweniae]